MTRPYHLEESRKSDETGDAYLNLFLATVRLAQRDADNPATLDFGDDKESIRQDAVEFLEWVAELATIWQDDEEEREVIREATRQNVWRAKRDYINERSRGEDGRTPYVQMGKEQWRRRMEEKEERLIGKPLKQMDISLLKFEDR